MKGLSMNKMLGSIKKKTGGSSSAPPVSAATPAASPEVTARNSVKAFCESGGNSKSDEVLFLPPIVDAAESSPAAAAECARIIRKFLSKEYTSRPSWQYNAIMLVRILTDNPGETFTRNFDDKFVDTIRAMLKNIKDPNVWRILMETLDDFELTRMDDQNLAPLVLMWKKEKDAAMKKHGGKRPPPVGVRPPIMSQQLDRHSQSYFSRAHHNNRLPEPVELASRLEEARTSAKLLEQVVMNTPTSEILNNDLIKEFADRCLSASRSLQGYMVSENPSPDNETMESLIDTNEQLQTALNQHKRAVLNSRKQLGLGTNSNEDSPAVQSENSDNEGLGRNGRTDANLMSGGIDAGPPSLLPTGKGKQAQSYNPSSTHETAEASSSRQSLKDEPPEDPFADPRSTDANDADDRLPNAGRQIGDSNEPLNPGFGGSSSSNNNNGSSSARVSSFQGGFGKLSSSLGNSRNGSRSDDLYEASSKGKGSLTNRDY